jgi:hypothetical protein
VAIAGLNAGGGSGRRPSLAGNGWTGVPNAGEDESVAALASSCARRKASIFGYPMSNKEDSEGEWR